MDAYPQGKAGTTRTAEGERFECTLWSDVIRLEGAEAIAWYEHDFYAGLPAVTRHTLGRGTAYYLGTGPAAAYMAGLLGSICDAVGVSAPLDVPPDVEVTERHTAEHSYLFILNHGEEEAAVELPTSAVDLLVNGDPTTLHRIQPGGVAIVAMR